MINFQKNKRSVWTLLMLYASLVPSSTAISEEDVGSNVITTQQISSLFEVKIVLDQLGYDLHKLGEELDENNEQFADRLYDIEKTIQGISYNLLGLTSTECDTPLTTSLPPATTPASTSTIENCMQIRESGFNSSGAYEIKRNPDGDTVKVYCDMELDGGGWTAIQRRGTKEMNRLDRVNFRRNWTDYESGFGNGLNNGTDEYWIGLLNIHLLTRDCNNELAVKLTHWNGASEIYKYTQFNVSGQEDKYRIAIGGFVGHSRNDAMFNHNGMQFSTFDNDNDDDYFNIAASYNGGWWYIDTRFMQSCLNGLYPTHDSNGTVTYGHGIFWNQPSTHSYSYKKSEMLIRPNC